MTTLGLDSCFLILFIDLSLIESLLNPNSSFIIGIYSSLISAPTPTLIIYDKYSSLILLKLFNVLFLLVILYKTSINLLLIRCA